MTDITELAQLRDRTVDYPHYLVECDCGKIYPSNELNGGEPMGDTGWVNTWSRLSSSWKN